MEMNQINNYGLKAKVCDTITAMLINAKIISMEEIKDMVVEFGYIYQKENGEIESLIKSACNGKINYFAIQHNQVKHINIVEQQYNVIIEDMKKMHECLQKDTHVDEKQMPHSI